MKEARIIAPNIVSVLLLLQQIDEVFGGYTMYDGFGDWKGETEKVNIVDIAYEPSDENDAKLYDIAWTFGKTAKQEEVYLRYGNGHVQMVTEKGCMDNGHGHYDISLSGVLEAVNTLADVGATSEDRVSAFEYIEASLKHKAAA